MYIFWKNCFIWIFYGLTKNAQVTIVTIREQAFFDGILKIFIENR